MAERKLEDFIVNGNYNTVNKNNKKTTVIVVISLVLVLIAIVGGYFAYNKYFKRVDDTVKNLFLSYVLDNNIKDIVENDLYEEAYKKIVRNSFSADTNINFSTTFEIEDFENIDFSKFTLDNNLVRSTGAEKVYTDSILKYLDNDIFTLKTISMVNDFAISSDQIVTKYISGDTIRMNNLVKEVTGSDVNANFGKKIVEQIEDTEVLELTEKDVNEIEDAFLKLLKSKIDAENVTQKEVIVESNGEQVNTIAYTASIRKKDVLDILNKIKTEIKKDKISDKILTNKNTGSIFDFSTSASYNMNLENTLANVIDSSSFLVTENVIGEQVVTEDDIEAAQGGLESVDVEDEELELRHEEADETTRGYEAPTVSDTNSENTDNVGDEIIITNTVTSKPNNNNNNNNSNNGNSGTVINTTIVNNVSGPTNTNTVKPTTNTTNTTNTVNNTTNNTVSNTTNTVKNEIIITTNTISSDKNTTNTTPGITTDIESSGTRIPISKIQSVETVVKNAKKRSLAADIQIIQNPNLTSPEDLNAQEENREIIKQETEALFSSITDAIETNVEIVSENISTEKDKAEFEKNIALEIELIKCILFKNKMNITYNEYENIIEEFYENVQDHDFDNLKITVYVSNEKTIKIVIEDERMLQIELDFITINEAESKIKVLFLDDKEMRSGNLLEVYKSQREAACSYELAYSWITEGKIVEKFSCVLSTKGTTLGNVLENDLNLQYVKGKEDNLKIGAKNTILFTERTIEDLNTDNALFLNMLSNEEYTAIVSAIKGKTMDVLAEKMTDLDLIDINTGNEFVNRVQEEAENNAREELSNITKQEALDLIVNKVSIMMGECQARGEEVTLDILKNLTIDGYEVSVAVSNDEALVMLNDYRFIINSNFVIEEV